MSLHFNSVVGSDIKVEDLAKKFKNNDELFWTDGGLIGKFCTGTDGPRLEIFEFTSGSSYGQHVCGCPLERNMRWLGKNAKGELVYGAVYGHTDVPDLTLSQLIEYMAPQWQEELFSRVKWAQIKLKWVSGLVVDVNEEKQAVVP